MTRSSKTLLAKLRKAEPADVSAVQELVAAAYQHYIVRLGKPPGPMRADYERLIRQRFVWVLDVQNVVGGVLVVIPHDTHLLLENVAVAPEFQGRGLGRLLIETAEQMAMRLGVPEVRLYTNVAMTENIALYQKLGYEETHRAQHGGYTRVFFRKTLTIVS